MVLATPKRTTPFDIWWPICRSLVGLLAGYIVSQLAFTVVWSICFLLFPDVWNPELAGSDFAPAIMSGCLGLSALVAGFVAGLFAPKRPILIGSVSGIIEIPNGAVAMLFIARIGPRLGIVLSLIVLPLALLGALLAARFSRASGPQPYDMRQKNMAC